jgi:enamine deaminase RidA (YjgF/YER057c/UK114 family)
MGEKTESSWAIRRPVGDPAFIPLPEGQGSLAGPFDNLETLLRQAGFTLADVVRLKIFATDMDAFLAVFPAFKARLDQAQCHCAQTLIGVVRLAAPSLLVEIEATPAQ